MAMTSRWKCIVAFGFPVVPEVKAIRATSSAAVSQFLKLADLPAAAVSSVASAPPSPNVEK